MRLFVALYPPPEALDDIFAEVMRLRVGEAEASGINVRLVDRATAHITLAYLGDVDDERLPDVEAALGRAARPGRTGFTAAVPGRTLIDSASGPPRPADAGVPVGVDPLSAAAGALVGDDPLRATGPPRLRIAGGGQFGEGRLTVLWAGLGGELAALHVLAGEIRSELRRAELPYDERTFQPHFTIARPGGRIDQAAVEQDLCALDRYRGPAWRATEMVLVRSHLGPRPLYHRLTAWPL